MAEVVRLAATTDADDSGDITVAGTPVTVFIFATDGKIDAGVQCAVKRKVEETGLYQAVCDERGAVFLTAGMLERTFYADGTYLVDKPPTNEAVGIATQ